MTIGVEKIDAVRDTEVYGTGDRHTLLDQPASKCLQSGKVPVDLESKMIVLATTVIDDIRRLEERKVVVSATDTSLTAPFAVKRS